MIVNGPDTSEQTQFEHKFGGTIAVFYGVDGWAYDKKGKLYPLPEDMTDGDLSEMMKKSMVENHDCLFEFLQKTSKDVEILSDILY